MTTKASATASAVTLAAGLAGGYWLAPACVHLPGDANNDGIVNQADIDSVLANWLSEAPPMTGPLPIDLRGARVYTDGNSNNGEGWQIDGNNWCLVRVRGESEDIAAALGIATGGTRYLAWSPDFHLPDGSVP